MRNRHSSEAQTDGTCTVVQVVYWLREVVRHAGEQQPRVEVGREHGRRLLRLLAPRLRLIQLTSADPPSQRASERASKLARR